MDKNKAIAVTLYNRPLYTHSMLWHLRRCTGFEDYTLFLHVEPENALVIEIAQHFPHNKKCIHINPSRLGCNHNIHNALTHAFEEFQFVIFLEDDVLLARDALQFYEFCSAELEEDPRVFTITPYNRENSGSLHPYALHSRQWFHAFGMATWKNRWIGDMDQFLALSNDPVHESWDCPVNYRIRGERCEVFPYLSRCQNIGAKQGTWVPSAEWHSQNQRVDVWRENTIVEMERAFGSPDIRF
jgi:hypothetical protein